LSEEIRQVYRPLKNRDVPTLEERDCQTGAALNGLFILMWLSEAKDTLGLEVGSEM
jgi:hypothetical protein